MKRWSAAATAAVAVVHAGAWAGEPADLASAIAGGKVNLDLRLRHERVEQDNALEDADALTLRTRLGYATRSWNGLSAFAEMEYVSALVDDYSLPPPPAPTYSVVADPEGGELNQWGLRYGGVPGLSLTAGRSRLILDNARWVGNVGWRQNEQTFDGAFLVYSGVPGLALNYAYLAEVNTITATNVDLDGHLFNAGWTALPQLALSGYAYLLDDDRGPDFDTYGLRASGGVPLGAALKLVYAAEYARQQAQTADAEFDTDYLLAEAGLAYKATTLKLGWERLGSDGGVFALQTPLATKHAFQGWADVFLSTPPQGVEDLYLSAETRLGAVKLAAVWHMYSADEATPELDDYGQELNLCAGMPLAGKLTGLLKYARYEAEDFSVDTEKLWLQLEYAF